MSDEISIAVYYLTPLSQWFTSRKSHGSYASHRDLQMLFGNTASRLYRGRTKRTNGNLQKDAIGEIVTERTILFTLRTTPISLYIIELDY